MQHSNIYIKLFDSMGQGLACLTPIPANAWVMQCELLVLSPKDTATVNSTELQHYTFKYNETQDCFCLGSGEIFNHSDTPNVSYELMDFDGRKVMTFTSLREILSGEQLFIDYNADVAMDVAGYTTSESLIG